MSQLIIDTRERNVTRHVKELSEINHVIKQITTADYVITQGGKIVAAIERKTLEDFAASLKDGRSDNKSKLLKLRDVTGCRVLYIIEGPAFPSPNATYGNIPYRYIESAIFHLMMRDNIMIFKTSDTLDTIKTLGRMLLSIDNIKGGLDLEVANADVGAPVNAEVNADAGVGVNADAANAAANIDALLTQTHVKTDHEINRELWSTFAGISIESADDYNCVWTVKQIVCGAVPRVDIMNHKLRSGRKISKKVVSSLTGINRAVEVRLLAKVPGVSAKAAAEIVMERSLAQFLSYDIAGMSMCRVGKKRLGDERATRIKRLFDYVYTV